MSRTGWKTVQVRQDVHERINAVRNERSIADWINEALEAALKGPVPSEPVIRATSDAALAERVLNEMRRTASGRPGVDAFRSMAVRQAAIRRERASRDR